MSHPETPKRTIDPEQAEAIRPASAAQSEFRPASFDMECGHLAELKKLQDPAKFQKARFSFRLYKR